MMSNLEEITLRAANALECGDLELAESSYRFALSFFVDDEKENERQLGVLVDLARLLILRKEIFEGIILLEQALVITATLYGGSGERTASALTSLASVMRKGGSIDQLEQAEQLYNQAIRILFTIHGQDGHTDIANAFLGLAMSIEAQGRSRYDDALRIYEDALAMRRMFFGERHSDTADALLCLASLLARTDENILAAAVRYEQALSIFLSIYSKDHHRVE